MIGYQVLGGFKREKKEEKLVLNRSLGPSKKLEKVPSEVIASAQRAAKVLKVEISAIDMVIDQKTGKPVIIEVNEAPEFRVFEKRTGITCLFDHQDVPDISNTIATAAYRIAQEALTNALRHANASQIHVSLTAKNGLLRLTVSDNGKGFSTAILSDIQALGIAGMRERAALVGGRTEVKSTPENGTCVNFTVAMDQQEMEES